MKKIPLFVLFILLIVIMTSCATEKKYENIEQINNGVNLKWGLKTYTFYGALPKDSLIGKQIAIVDNDEKHKIFEVKGFKSDEWIIEYYDVIMPTFALYKTDDITVIPTELEQ